MIEEKPGLENDSQNRVSLEKVEEIPAKKKLVSLKLKDEEKTKYHLMNELSKFKLKSKRISH
jgi:ribosomal protein L14E/L6E/L27E